MINMAFRFDYDNEYDILYIYNYPINVEESVEISENIVLDLNKNEEIAGIEIFDASEFFSAFNSKINKEFLKSLRNVSLEYKEFRNQLFILLLLNSEKEQISQILPPLRKSEYKSPLLR